MSCERVEHTIHRIRGVILKDVTPKFSGTTTVRQRRAVSASLTRGAKGIWNLGPVYTTTSRSVLCIVSAIDQLAELLE